MQTIDWFVVAVYLLAITVVGLAAGRRIRGSDHYFLGRRGFGRLLMIGQNFGVGTHAEMPVSLAGAVYSIGISAIWFQWKNLFATPFYWILAPLLRRFRRTTCSEVLEDRYGSWMGCVYTVFALVFFIINLGSLLKGAAKVLNQTSGGGAGVDRIVLAMTAAFLLYSFAGGLTAAAWTDLIQGFLIIALSFLLIPLGWAGVGGMDGMRAALAPARFSLVTPKGLTIWSIAMLTLNALVGILAQPHLIAAVGTGKTERNCRVGFFYGNYIKRFCTIGWAVVGLMVAAMIARGMFGSTALADPEDAFGFACRHLLFPGSRGLLIACVLAATMSASSAFMVDAGAIFTFGVYRRFLAPDASDRRSLWVGRLSGLLVALAGVAYSLFLIKRVLYSFLFTETMATFIGISLVGGIVWRRANRWGALASIMVALFANLTIYHLRGQSFDYWDPTVFAAAFSAGTAALIFISFLTPPEPPAKLAIFFKNLNTSADLNSAETAPDSPGREEQAAARGEQLLVVNLLNLRQASSGFGIRAYGEDIYGLVIGSLLSAGLIALLWLLLRP